MNHNLSRVTQFNVWAFAYNAGRVELFFCESVCLKSFVVAFYFILLGYTRVNFCSALEQQQRHLRPTKAQLLVRVHDATDIIMLRRGVKQSCGIVTGGNYLTKGVTTKYANGALAVSSYKHYSSNRGDNSHTSSSWPAITLGLVAGAAGVTYWYGNRQNVAQCGSVDSWASEKGAEPSTADISSTSVTSDSQAAANGEETTPTFPTEVPYLIIGAGTAAMAAYRAIRTKHADAKVLLVGEEEYKPYMRPPLSKDMWFTDKSVTQENRFTTWSGKDRSIFFEQDSYYCTPNELASSAKGGVAVATGLKVTSLDAEKKCVTLSNGSEIKYEKCLLATGGRPRNLPSLQTPAGSAMDNVTLFRSIDDFKQLDKVTDGAKSVLVIGGGFLGSELACALGKKASKTGMTVTQIFPEAGNMGKVLPAYLSNWTTDKVRSENVRVMTGVSVEKTRLSDDQSQVELLLTDHTEVAADHVVVAIGLEPNTQLADSASLEVDDRLGGFVVNAELEAATDLWVAGDAACFYDVKLGRRRVEHHDHAVVSGRLAGENMTGASKRFLHQSMFWSDLGPDVGYEAIGLVDSQLPTIAVFAKASADDSPAAVENKTGESLRSETEQNLQSSGEPELCSASDKYGKGVVFYMKGKRVVGVLCWNVFNKIGIARKIIKDGAEHEDLSELAKLFDLYENAQQSEAAAN